MAMIPGNRFVFPAWSQQRRKAELKDVLLLVPENSWSWYVVDFDGIGVPPDAMDMSEFNDITNAGTGYATTWVGLKNLAENLEQTFEGVFIGVDSVKSITKENVDSQDYSSASCVLELFDGSEWSVLCNSNSIDRGRVAEHISRFMNGGGERQCS